MKDKLRELAERWQAEASQWMIRGEDVPETLSHCAAELLAILDAEGDGGAVVVPELWIEFTDDGHNIRLWTRSKQQAEEEIREGRKLLGFYSRAQFKDLNEQSGNSGQLEFQNGILEGLSIAKAECDKRVLALDGGDNKSRRESSASQCAEALRLEYVRISRDIYPLPVIDASPTDSLQTLEAWAMAGGELHGDDVPRFRALTDRIAPEAHPARSGVVSDEELQAEAEAFAVRAGFTYGWENLESWARRMAERAALEHFAKGERHER